MIAEGVQGAVTGSEDVQVTHMLYADDLTLLANLFKLNAPDVMQNTLNTLLANLFKLNAPDVMQNTLNRLLVYARSKHLTINTAKS